MPHLFNNSFFLSKGALPYLLFIGFYFFFSPFASLTAPIRAQTNHIQEEKREFSISYPLQSVYLSPPARSGIESFIKRQKAKDYYLYYLIQGFACRVGGFPVSLATAELRAKYIRDILQKQAIDKRRIKTAPGIVREGFPRKRYRRINLKVFSSKERWQRAYKNAQAKAQEINEKSKEALEEPKEKEEERRYDSVQELYFTLLLIGFLIAFRYSTPTLDFLKRRKHRLRPKEAQVLQFLSQERAKPFYREKKLLPLRSVKAFLESNQSFPYMTKKTKASLQKRSETIALPGIAKGFANKSLKSLCKSPVHALTGLSPRHGQLLHEAFGIKTVEDLAKLKYVEIAKAIAILANYEK